jgi:hypothetical protein
MFVQTSPRTHKPYTMFNVLIFNVIMGHIKIISETTELSETVNEWHVLYVDEGTLVS